MTACSTCKYWQGWNEKVTAECRRRSPVVDAAQGTYLSTAVWPKTKGVDWCGDYEKEEQK